MKKAYFFLLFIFSFHAKAQINLVPNGDFEYFIHCQPQIENVPNWYTLAGSPDYLNSCFVTGGYSVPLNIYGFQYSRSGNAYTLFGVSLNWYHFREYIATPLSIPLIIGKKYYFGMYVSLADSSEYGIDNIGALFTTGPIDTTGQGGYIINFSPQISSKSVIIDTVNWILVDGIFTANGGENYLTIGCFVPDDSVNFITISQVPRLYAGYYLDDVFLYEYIEPDTSKNITLPNAFTPNTDGINDIFRVQGQNIKTLNGKILNRWGQELFTWTDVNSGWDGMYKGKDVPEGTYFYVVTVGFEDGEVRVERGSLMLTR